MHLQYLCFFQTINLWLFLQDIALATLIRGDGPDIHGQLIYPFLSLNQNSRVLHYLNCSYSLTEIDIKLRSKLKRIGTLESCLPHRVRVSKARNNVVQNTECYLKLITRSLLESKKNATILNFTERQGSSNFPNVIRYNSNGMELDFRFHLT